MSGADARAAWLAWQARADRLERRRWLRSALVMLLVAGGLAIGSSWPRPSPRAEAAPAALPLVIELAPAPSTPLRPSALPPGPQRQEAPQPRPAPVLRTETVEIDAPAVAEIALPVASVAAEPLPQSLPPAPLTSAPPGEQATAAERTGAPRQAAHALAPSAAQVSFRARLLGHLQRHKRYPPAAQARRQQGVPTVRFTMDRDGRVLDSRLEHSSHHAALDAEALALLQRAQPMPPLPEEITGATLEIVVPIEFFLKR